MLDLVQAGDEETEEEKMKMKNRIRRNPLIVFSFPLFQLITREHFEDALKELQDEGIIVVMGKNTIRIC